ncbi:MAG: hypothetical protein V1493_06785 [Candidatus Diapherotrites archaeon]
MDKRWVNLLGLVALIAIAVFAYFFVFQAPPFEQRLGEMKQSWLGAGLDGQPLHLSYDKLNTLSDKELSDLKAGLLKFTEAEKNPAAKELGDAYVSLMDVSIYRKKMLDLQADLSAEEDPCAVLAKFDLLTQYKESLLESTNSYLSKVDSFVAGNPEAAKGVELQKGTGASELEQAVAEHKALVAQLKEACK